MLLVVSWPSWILSLFFFFLLLGGSVWDDAIVADAQGSHYSSCVYKKTASKQLRKQAWFVNFYATKIDTYKLNRYYFGQLEPHWTTFAEFVEVAPVCEVVSSETELKLIRNDPSRRCLAGQRDTLPWDCSSSMIAAHHIPPHLPISAACAISCIQGTTCMFWSLHKCMSNTDYCSILHKKC